MTIKHLMRNPQYLVYTAGGAFIGYALTSNVQGAIMGGLIGFLISLKY